MGKKKTTRKKGYMDDDRPASDVNEYRPSDPAAGDEGPDVIGYCEPDTSDAADQTDITNNDAYGECDV
jgi:hypothetical protein